MPNLKQFITVRGQYEGWHLYKDAPKEIAFLRDSHRHMFKWKAKIQVFHHDRELEFFLTKHEIEVQLNYRLRLKKWKDLGSCEEQAASILDIIRIRYGATRLIEVTVSEDGESDAAVQWEP